MQEVFDYLPRIPALARYRPAELAIERLAGLTNRNYKITPPDGDAVVLRIPGEGTSAYIDRKAEAVSAKVAADAGVSAPLVHFDASDGLQVTRFIAGAVTMNAERFCDLGSVARAAHAFHQIHECGHHFATRFELFQMIDNYLGLLNSKSARIPDGYAAVQREAEAVRAALGRHRLPLRPCHCDPLCENFLDTGRMVMYKAMCDLLWTLWGCIQVMNENPVDDFWAYATNRFERCQRLMGAADFGGHLDAVRRGA